MIRILIRLARIELSTQSKPDRACARAGWKIGQWQRSMNRRGASRRFQAIAGHHFQCMLAQCGAIRRNQDVAVSLCQFESVNEQPFEIMLDLKCFSSGRTRKSWRIENDRIKFLTSPGEPWQYGSHIIRDEAMIHCWQVVQRKILASPCQILFGKIDVEGACSATCRAHGKRAGVGKAVQQSLRRDMTDVAAILSLIQEQTRRIACAEIYAEFQMPFGGDRL